MNLTKEKQGIHLGADMTRLREAVVNFIVPLICIVASVLVGLLFLMPAMKNRPLLLAELDSSEKLSAQLSSKKTALNKLIDFREIVTENANLVDSILVSEAKVPELLAQVSQIAQEAGFEVTRLTYSYSKASATSSASLDTAPAVSVQTVAVSLGVRGSYDQLIAFLSNIETAARLIDVENYRFSRDEDAILDVSLTLTSPYLFVQSSAVTDESISLDITSPEFLAFLNKVKVLRLYKITSEDLSAIVVQEEVSEEEVAGEAPVTTENAETTVGEGVPVDFQALP